MREKLADALKYSQAEYTEIRIEEVDSTWINYQGLELNSIGSSKTIGGVVRALHKGGWGCATFNNMNDLGKMVREASEAAQLVGNGISQFAEVTPTVDQTAIRMKNDFRQVPLYKIKSAMEKYNRIIMNHHEKIESSDVAYQDTFRKIRYSNSEGTYIEDERPDLLIRFSAISRDGSNVQKGFENLGAVDGFLLTEDLDEKAKLVAQRAVDLLSAPPVTGGNYTVVLDPRMTGIFVHEAFGHLSESDFVCENDRMKEIMVPGRRFGQDILNIIDDGTLPDMRGTHKYDDEGVKTKRNYLVKNGILAGQLHSRETAAKMGREPSGNARAISYQHEPIVRMSNTYIDKGNTSFEDMIKDIKLGLYAIDYFGGQTSIEMFTFSAGHGYMIRDGQVAELVRDIVLTGNVFDTLMNIDAIGDQLVISKAGGNCSKGNQRLLPVGLGGPHIRVQNVIVGGRQG